MNSISTGTKFYKYIDGQEKPEVVRVYREIGPNTKMTDGIICLNEDGKRIKIQLEKLLTEYRCLSGDGVIIFVVAKMSDTMDDVIVSVQKRGGGKKPYAVCRQSIQDFFTASITTDEQYTYLGMSISKDTCPAEIDFDMFLSCSGIKFSKTVTVYMNDTLDQILNLFSNDKFDETLRDFGKKIRKNSETNGTKVAGLCNSLKELLESNEFMYDFRRLFNVAGFPESIEEGVDNLSEKNLIELSKMIHKNILGTYVMKYAKDINLREIKRDYLLAYHMTHEHNTPIYILGYDAEENIELPSSMENV